MSEKTKKIIGWILTGLIAIVFLGSAIGKFTLNEETIKAAAKMGFTADSIRILGIIEIISFIFFLIPRTGIIGTLLLAAYMGGAIATHVQHQIPLLVPVLVECFIWITAYIRFPELRKRILNKKIEPSYHF